MSQTYPQELLELSYGSYFGGACDIFITQLSDDTAECDIEGSNGWGWFPDDEIFTFPASECEKLRLKVAPVLKWEKEYRCEHRILDGHGWSICSHFEGTKKSSGYMAYPEDYESVMNGILSCIESIRSYDPSEKKNTPLLDPCECGSFFCAGKRNQSGKV